MTEISVGTTIALCWGCSVIFLIVGYAIGYFKRSEKYDQKIEELQTLIQRSSTHELDKFVLKCSEVDRLRRQIEETHKMLAEAGNSKSQLIQKMDELLDSYR